MFVAADIWYDSPLFTWMSNGWPMFGDWAKPMNTFLHYGWGQAGIWAAVSLAGVSMINVFRDLARRPARLAEPALPLAGPKEVRVDLTGLAGEEPAAGTIVDALAAAKKAGNAEEVGIIVKGLAMVLPPYASLLNT